MMARKSSPPSDKGKGRKARDSENDLSRGRAALPPPAGMDVMPRPILADDIREDGKSVVEVEASEAERIALAEAYHLVGISSLKARLKLAKRGPVIRITGALKAHLTQICVVTMEPFESEVEDQIELEFAPPAYVTEAWERLAQLEASGSTEDLSEPPDQIVDGKIDLGAITSEALALALDPYPKKPGAEFEVPADAAPTPDESPFAVLARLKGQGDQSTS
jgi:uncharacterized metal-binding protein YceD (DUF177 family)